MQKGPGPLPCPCPGRRPPAWGAGVGGVSPVGFKGVAGSTAHGCAPVPRYSALLPAGRAEASQRVRGLRDLPERPDATPSRPSPARGHGASRLSSGAGRAAARRLVSGGAGRREGQGSR